MGVKGEKVKILRGACPHCKGDVLGDYKHRPWLGKCIKCSRILRVKGDKVY